MSLQDMPLIVFFNISLLPINVSCLRMNDNHMRFQTSFPFSLVHAEANRTRETFVFATFKFCVVI